jgi:hypothetical protein
MAATGYTSGDGSDRSIGASPSVGGSSGGGGVGGGGVGGGGGGDEHDDYAAARWHVYVHDKAPPTARFMRAVPQSDEASADALEAEQRRASRVAQAGVGTTARDGHGRWAPFVVADETKGGKARARLPVRTLTLPGAPAPTTRAQLGWGLADIDIASHVIECLSTEQARV